MLTGWEEGKPDAGGEVGTRSAATQSTPTFSRDALGAGLDSILRRLGNNASGAKKDEKLVRGIIGGAMRDSLPYTPFTETQRPKDK